MSVQPAPTRGARRAVRAATVLSILSLLGACVSEGPPPRRSPREVREQPAGLVVDRVVPAIDKLADDTDRNGYYDTFRVAVFLFASGYAQSIQGDGTLECRLTDPESGKEMAKWTFSREAMQGAWGLSGVMPGYNLLLNMNQVGSDKVGVSEALFSCQFRPTGGGAPVTSLSRLVVMVGPLR